MGKDVLVLPRKCPFYGYHFSERAGLLLDNGGNQCGLITDGYSPCRMEIDGLRVDWNVCPLNNRENSERFNRMLENSSVLPSGSSETISFRNLYLRTMGQN